MRHPPWRRSHGCAGVATVADPAPHGRRRWGSGEAATPPRLVKNKKLKKTRNMGGCTLKHGDSYHPKCEIYMIYKIPCRSRTLLFEVLGNALTADLKRYILGMLLIMFFWRPRTSKSRLLGQCSLRCFWLLRAWARPCRGMWYHAIMLAQEPSKALGYFGLISYQEHLRTVIFCHWTTGQWVESGSLQLWTSNITTKMWAL